MYLKDSHPVLSHPTGLIAVPPKACFGASLAPIFFTRSPSCEFRRLQCLSEIEDDKNYMIKPSSVLTSFRSKMWKYALLYKFYCGESIMFHGSGLKYLGTLDVDFVDPDPNGWNGSRCIESGCVRTFFAFKNVQFSHRAFCIRTLYFFGQFRSKRGEIKNLIHTGT
jgi:hypothetical protein